MHIALYLKHVVHVCACNCSTTGFALIKMRYFACGLAHKDCFERRLNFSKACGASLKGQEVLRGGGRHFSRGFFRVSLLG